MKLKDDDILNIIISELTNAPMADNLEKPLEYYLGLPNDTEVEGRSCLTSTDVADSIEWILPQIMKSFSQTNEIVTFDPYNEADEKQSEIESEYVYHVLMKKNPGFICIHQMVKDALMQRNGILKVYYESKDEIQTRRYTGLTLEEVQVILSPDNVELIESSQSDDGFDIKFKLTKKVNKICVESVPLEEFRVSANHNSIDLTGARFTAHVTEKTLSELREQGIPENKLEQLTAFSNNASNYRFQAQGENVFNGANNDIENEAMQLYAISECYVYMDIDGDGIAEYVKVTCGGLDVPTVILSVEEIEMSPWISTTAILMPHKFQGQSIYDRIKEIQDHKTALIRNIQDNLYLQNNQRNAVLEGQVNIEDMLVSRPGGIVRVTRPDAIVPLITPQTGQAAFDMMRYLDEVRSGRSGVSAEGSATPQNIGNKVGSEGVERMMTAKEELVGLIIRVIAETGVKPLCLKIRDLARQHIDTIEDFQFRGQWVQVHPSTWIPRNECTVRVGTGSGDTRQKLVAIDQVIERQLAALQMPGQSIVNPVKIYSALNDFCKFAGLSGGEKYFVDPQSEEGQVMAQQAQQGQQAEQQKADEQNMAMMQMQGQLAQAEMLKAQAAQQNNLLKHQIETDKQTHVAQMSVMKAQLERAQLLTDAATKDADTEFKYDQLNTNTALELTKMGKQQSDMSKYQNE
jgi:hypothetical protein